MDINQLPLFKELNPYSGGIDTDNRWIRLAALVPWKEMEEAYVSYFSSCKRNVIKPSRLLLGLFIGQMTMKLSDLAILEYFHENPYFQYFCGYESFVPKKSGKRICHDSLLSKRRKRLGKDYTDEFERQVLEILKAKGLIKGNQLILDATVFCADITYPNDVKLLNSVREYACKWILRIKNELAPKQKIRTYRRVARRAYLNYCKKRKKTYKVIRKTTKTMLQYTQRNVAQLEGLLVAFRHTRSDIAAMMQTSLHTLEQKLTVAKNIVEQQLDRYHTRGRRVANRIVSLQQPNVRPIVRGKDGKAVEFGAKTQVARVDGFAFLDDCQYDAFHEGIRVPNSLQKHQDRFDTLPTEVIADGIYTNRNNRALLDHHDIAHNWPDLGRPPKQPDSDRLKRKAATRKRQRQRNAIEGLFGTLKKHGNLNRIKWTIPHGETMQIQLGLATFNLNKALNMA